MQLHVDMEMFTVYFNPSDFPGKYVIRKWILARGFQGPIPTDQKYIADTLEDVRKNVPPEMVKMERYDQDDPTIVEVWL